MMKFIIAFILFILIISCNQENQHHDEDDKLINESSITMYFGTYKKVRGSITRVDTYEFERKIFNDSILTFAYNELNDTNQFLLDHIQFIVGENGIEHVRSDYLEDRFLDSVYVINQNGSSTLLLESQTKDSTLIDANGIHIISLDYGVILGYSKSWGNYYYIIETSNDSATKRISDLQRLYLMKKNKI